MKFNQLKAKFYWIEERNDVKVAEIKNIKNTDIDIQKKLNDKGEFKNQKDLCNYLGWEYTKGKGQKSLYKELDRYCTYHKQGNKIIIDFVRPEPLPKVDGRANNKGGNHLKYNYSNINIEKKYQNYSGVYAIILDDNIYVGSTTVSFKHRIMGHFNVDNKLPTREMVLNGAKVIALWINENNENETFVRNMENKYIDEYAEDDSWNLVNKNKAWDRITKNEYKNIRVNKNDYEQIIDILKNNNIKINNIK